MLGKQLQKQVQNEQTIFKESIIRGRLEDDIKAETSISGH